MFGSVLGLVMAWTYIYARSRDRIKREAFWKGYDEGYEDRVNRRGRLIFAKAYTVNPPQVIKDPGP